MRKFAIMIAMFAGAVWALHLAIYENAQHYREEQRGFWKLSNIACDMISRRETSVTPDRNGKLYISSFAAFRDFVLQDKTASRLSESRNPFPRILPSGTYIRTEAPIRGPTDAMFWSRQSYLSERHLVLRADGSVRFEPVAGAELKAAAHD